MGRVGPEVKLVASCLGCVHLPAAGPLGRYCEHPRAPIDKGLTVNMWCETPAWCPELAAAKKKLLE